MTTAHSCPDCGAIVAGTAAGHCPTCLLDLGLKAGGADSLAPALGRFGNYELLAEIAQGGMGTVYRARQLLPDRVVALKMIRLTRFTDAAALERFQLESESASRLDHPNIVPIYEVGEHAGQPFYTMRLMEGGSLAFRIDDWRLTIDERKSTAARPGARALKPRMADRKLQIAKLLAKVARAVHHAHERGLLHRDLKPGNILLDERGEPHVADFGLARPFGVPPSDDSVADEPATGGPAKAGTPNDLTVSGAIVGTPHYMSPEQASGRSKDLTVAADVYSLGAILFELLVGRPPFPAGTPLPTLRLVTGEEPAPPTFANSLVDSDLQIITLKCLEKDPQRRYRSAAELADELERWQRGEPIHARPVSQWERALKWSRRRPAVAALVAVSLLGTIAFIVTLLINDAKLKREKAHAVAQEKIARTERQRAETVALEEMRQRRRAEEIMLRQDLQRAEAALAANDCSAGLAGLARAWREHPDNRVLAERLFSALTWRNLPLPVGEPISIHASLSFAGFSPDDRLVVTLADRTIQLWETATGHAAAPPLMHGRAINEAVFSPNGRQLLSASQDHTARLWEVPTGQAIGTPLRHQGPVLHAEFSPDGEHVLTVSQDGTAKIWNLETRAAQGIGAGHSAAITFARFSPDGALVVTTSADLTARLWDSRTGAARSPPMAHGRSVLHAVFSPDGTRLATVSADNRAYLWDVRSGEPVAGPLSHQTQIAAVVFSPDSERFITLANEFAMNLWNARNGQSLGKFIEHPVRLRAAEFSRDGRWLLTAGGDHIARVWDTATGALATQTIRHRRWIRSAHFNATGRQVITASLEGAVQRWDREAGAAQPLTFFHTGGVHTVSFSRDGRRVLTAGAADKTAMIRDAHTGLSPALPLAHKNHVIFADFSPDGRRALTASWDNTAKIWDAETGELLAGPLAHADVLTSARWSPDGRWVATASRDRTARIWDADSGAALTEPLRHRDTVYWVEFDSLGRRLVTASRDATAMVWDAATGEPLFEPLSHPERVLCAQFSPGGETLATACVDGRARLWSAETGELLSDQFRHEEHVQFVRFSPNGRTLATGARDGIVRLWELNSGMLGVPPSGGPSRENAELQTVAPTRTLRHQAAIRWIEFSPDGARLATASVDGTARLWDVATGLPLSEAFRHEQQVAHVQFSPDGRRLATASWDGTARIYEVPPWQGEAPSWLADLAEAVAVQRLDEERIFTALPAGTLDALRRQLLEDSHGTPHRDWLEWFFADRTGRGPHP